MENGAHARYQYLAWTVLRIAVGLAFITHGLPKLFGWLGGFGGAGEAAELMSRFGVAGVLETFGGLLIVLGLLTRPVAFLLSEGKDVFYDAEHFFDAYREHPDYAIECLRAAHRAIHRHAAAACQRSDAQTDGSPRDAAGNGGAGRQIAVTD